MTNKNSIIDAVEQRALALGVQNLRPDLAKWRQALTEVLAEARPVAWARFSIGDPMRQPELLPEGAIEDIRKASGAWQPLFTAPLAAAKPVEEKVYFKRSPNAVEDWVYVPPGTAKQHVREELITRTVLLFAAPPADERDARIAEAEESAARWGKFAAECCRERDELRTQLAAAQADAYEVCAKICEASNDNGDDSGIERDVFIWNKAAAYCSRAIRAAITTDQSAAGSVK